jgi:hypothetical protein
MTTFSGWIPTKYGFWSPSAPKRLKLAMSPQRYGLKTLGVFQVAESERATTEPKLDLNPQFWTSSHPEGPFWWENISNHVATPMGRGDTAHPFKRNFVIADTPERSAIAQALLAP